MADPDFTVLLERALEAIHSRAGHPLWLRQRRGASPRWSAIELRQRAQRLAGRGPIEQLADAPNTGIDAGITASVTFSAILRWEFEQHYLLIRSATEGHPLT